MSTRIAIPSFNPGGLEAALMPHFGKCEVFTLVTIDDGKIMDVSAVPGLPHEHGGCTAPVQYLADKGVSVMLAGGMGMRPLQAFQQSGIDVLFAGGIASVSQAVEAFLEKRLPPFGSNGLCGGGCSH